MEEQDSFAININAVQDLVGSDTNKVEDGATTEEKVDSDYIDYLELPMSDKELLELKEEWEIKWQPYGTKIKVRQETNKKWYLGMQNNGAIPSASNLLFEAEETFIPEALSKNPEPVVFSDNTDEGKEASNDLKTMLQFHADELDLRGKLAMTVRHESVYLLGVLKHGWDTEINDICTDVRKPKNMILDPDGYVDEHGRFHGNYAGERMETTAQDLIDMFPKSKDYITVKCNGKLGTSLVYTEWWTNKYCFSTFQEEVLDKHKNEFFNYEEGKPNHFATARMPYTFLTVFTLQEEPFDITSLIEQNIANQADINETDSIISKNLKRGTSGVALSGLSFTSETAEQARDSLYEEAIVLIPDGNMDAVKPIVPAQIPNGVFEAQMNKKNDLRSIFGTQGLSSQKADENTTARGMILNQSHDSSRIGGGIGDQLERVAKDVFNWWTQLYYVFYDEAHYGAVMGNGRAVEYVTLLMSNSQRKFVVSVSPNSMAPKDELTEMNQAIQLAEGGWLDPLTLFSKLNFPDPMKTAEQVTMFRVNPQLYMQTYFPQQAQAGAMMGGGAPPQGGQAPPEQGSAPTTLSQEPASASLSNVPLPK